MKGKIVLKGQLNRYLRWPMILVIFLVIMNLCVYSVDRKAGIVVTAGILIYVMIVAVIAWNSNPKIIQELIAFANEYNSVEKRMMDSLFLPYVVLDERGYIIWGNKAFSKLIGKEAYFDKSITSFFTDIPKNYFKGEVETGGLHISHKNKKYLLEMQKVPLGNILSENDIVEFEKSRADQLVTKEDELIVISFIDQTELTKLKQQIKDEKIVIGLAYLDNYEEALQSVEEVRRSLLIALIDRKMTRYFTHYEGILKKLEKDKYLILFKRSELDKMKEKNFNILEEVKNVNIGNEMKVTMSMGLGLNGGDYLQNYEHARIAIEMALGRGGDQVVVKDGNKISYFGGKSQSVEKNTRVKARVKAQALKEFISSRERVLIMGHKITDVDSFGAAIGIYRAAKALDKPAHIVLNDPTTSIRPIVNVFVESEEYNNDMFVSNNEAKSLVDNNTVLIVVDTNRPSYTECEDLLKMTKTIVVLDHHRRGSDIIENAVLSYIEPYASSTCEMVSEILQYFADGIRIRSVEADAMYAGIMIDTNNFTARAGVRTFEAAAFLRRNGADVTRVRKMLRDNIDAYKARAEVIRSAEIYKKYYAIGVCPSNGLESPTVVAAQAANELLDIEMVKASFVMTEYHGMVYISARSIDEANVQVMMERLGGGGHMNASGAQVNGDVNDIISTLKKLIDESIDKGEEK